jgi:MFS family permease
VGSRNLATAPSVARTGKGAVGLLVFTELGSGLLQGWFGPLLPTIGTHYNVGSAALNWVSVTYLLASVLFVPLITNLGDAFGHKRLLVWALTITAIGSYLVAFAPSFGLLLCGRVLQGALVAFLPLEFAIVRERAPEHTGRSIGRLVASLTIGAVVGGLGAGILLSATGSLLVALLGPAVFLTVCLPFIAFRVPETTVRNRNPIDWWGITLLGVGLSSLLAGISLGGVAGWGNALTISCLVGGVVLLVAWVLVERRVATPFIDLDVIAHGGIGVPLIIAICVGAQTFGATTASSLFLRIDPDVAGFGLGMSAASSGLVLSLFALASFVGAILSHRITRRFGSRRTIAFAGVLGALSYLLMIAVPGNAVAFTMWLALGGLGAGIMAGSLPAVFVRRARPDAVGVTSGLYNTSRTAAGAVAGAVFALIMAVFVLPPVHASAPATTSYLGYVTVWAIGGALCVATVVLSIWLGSDRPAGEAPDVATGLATSVATSEIASETAASTEPNIKEGA